MSAKILSFPTKKATNEKHIANDAGAAAADVVADIGFTATEVETRSGEDITVKLGVDVSDASKFLAAIEALIFYSDISGKPGWDDGKRARKALKGFGIG